MMMGMLFLIMRRLRRKIPRLGKNMERLTNFSSVTIGTKDSAFFFSSEKRESIYEYTNEYIYNIYTIIIQ